MNTSKIALYTNPDETLALTPAESIISMFEHTDKDGTLYIPEWPYDNSSDEKTRFYKCTMSWNKGDLDEALWHYECDFNALKSIAEKWESISSNATVEALPANLQKVWHIYIRDFEIGDIDMDLIMDISNRLETISMIDSTAEKISSGIEVSKEEMSFYNAYKGTAVSEKEEALYSSYRDAVCADAEHRVGENVAAYDVVIRAKRLCKLLALGAPKIIVDNEANLFAQAMVIHAYCKERTIVDDVE